jgi:hypothetical protein
MIILVILGIFSGIVYRAGGADWGKTTLWRDLGVPAICLTSLSYIGRSALHGPTMLKLGVFITSFLLFWAALTTYRYFLPKPKDYKFIHYALHGFFCGLAFLPFMTLGIHWYWILLRAMILFVTVGTWSAYTDQVDFDEGGRGVLFAITIPLLILP